MSKLTQIYLKTCLKYSSETGIFTWQKRRSQSKTWNTRYANKQAGSLNKNGYVYIRVDKKLYRAHRLAWLYMEGEWPENDIDHLDRDRSNNKWNNLEEKSHLHNIQNRGLFKKNTSGVPGVRWVEKNQRWLAQITINKKPKYLGSFVEKDDAIKARLTEEQNNPEWIGG